MALPRTAVDPEELAVAAQRYHHPIQAAKALQITPEAFHRLCRRHGITPRGHGTACEDETWRDDYLRGCRTPGCEGHPIKTGYCIPCEVARHLRASGSPRAYRSPAHSAEGDSTYSPARFKLEGLLGPERRN